MKRMWISLLVVAGLLTVFQNCAQPSDSGDGSSVAGTSTTSIVVVTNPETTNPPTVTSPEVTNPTVKALGASYSPASPKAGQNITITPKEGTKMGYKCTKVTGDGAFISGSCVYVAPNKGETATIKVEDSSGASISFNIVIAAVHGSLTVTQVGNWSWTVPDGVGQVTIKAWGGGGGGGGNVGSILGGTGGGGGAGQVTIPVTPKTSLTIKVGAGGLAGTSNAQNAPGGAGGSNGGGGPGGKSGPDAAAGGGGSGGSVSWVKSPLGVEVAGAGGGGGAGAGSKAASGSGRGGGGGEAGRNASNTTNYGGVGGAPGANTGYNTGGGGYNKNSGAGGGGGGGGGGLLGGLGGTTATDPAGYSGGGGGGGSCYGDANKVWLGSAQTPGNAGDANFDASRSKGGNAAADGAPGMVYISW